VIRLWLKLVLPTGALFILLWLVATWIYDSVPPGIDPIPVAFNPLRPHVITLATRDRAEVTHDAADLGAQWNMRVRLADPPELTGPTGAPLSVLQQGGTLPWEVTWPGHAPVVVRVRAPEGSMAELAVPLQGGGWALLEPGAELAEAIRLSKEWEQRQDAQVVIVILVAAMLLVGGLGLYLTWRLRGLQRCFRRLQDGDLDARVAGRGKDLIAQLGHSCDTMAERLQDLIKQQNDLLRMLAHELRTPLARMDLGLHLAQQEGSASPRLPAVRREIEHLDALIQDLTRLIRVGSQVATEAPVRIEVAPLLHELIGAHAADHPDIAFTLQVDEHLTLQAHPALLRVAVGNLLANAARHARSRFDVQVTCATGMIRIVVDDDGPGVPPAERQRIFLPFVALSSGGSGLGLAIVARVMATYGGTATCAASPAGGARFALQWPLSPAP
jgi:signal transduction histidine kinase